MSYVGRKSGRAALIHADIPSNLNLLGDYVKIPSATTTERDALTPVVGMLLYNTTVGMLQQYNLQGWASIDSPPTVSSFTYPDSQTALDPLGSTTQTLVITGTNFQAGLTVAIDGTAPTSTTRNSSTQVTITGYPAKAAATYSAGLVVTNTSGLAASADIAYDAVPAWTTAAGSLGSFADGAYTNSSASTIRIVAAEASDTIDYAQVSDAGGATIITSGVAGLTLGTTGANAGYLIGDLDGDESSTYNFYAKAQDDEGQFSAVRLFNIISILAATGGTTTGNPVDIGGTDYNIHAYLSSSTFIVAATMNIDILVVGGGAAGGYSAFDGSGRGAGGGAGGLIYITNFPVTAGTYTVESGAGGSGWNSGSNNRYGDNGTNSVFTGNSRTLTALGGGGGGQWDQTGNAQDGGSGGGSWYGTGSNALGGDGTQPANTGDGISTYNGTGFGEDGGDGGGTAPYGGGGGGAGAVGNDYDHGSGPLGGVGKDYSSIFGTTYGHSGWFAGGGGGSNYGGIGSGPYAGGQGGGGTGNNYVATGADGQGDPNTGGGGGSAHTGGSGIVLIRYLA